MPENDIIKIFISPLNDLKIRYMVSGAMAAIFYGVPRFTHDVDMVIDIDEVKIKELGQVFNLTEFYFPPEEVLLTEINRSSRGHFNIIHHETGFRADLYLTGRDPFQEWGLNNTNSINYDDLVINVAPVEYVIIKKLEYYKEGRSEKHILDIQQIIKISSFELDLEFLHQKIQEYNLKECWGKVERLKKN